MRSTVIFIVLLVLACSYQTVYPSDALEHEFEQGNEYYEQGDYTSAIDQYHRVLSTGVENPVLYYNLGNAYFKTGQLGYAIAMYNRGMKYDPRNDDLRANLRFARQQMIDKVDPAERNPIWNWIKGTILNLTANEWSALTSFFFLVIILIASWMIWSRKRTSILKGLLTFVIVLFVVSSIGTGINVHLNFFTPKGTIVTPEVSVKVGPGDDFDEQFIAHEGLTFEILNQESGWYQGVFDNRLKGWVRISDAVKI